MPDLESATAVGELSLKDRDFPLVVGYTDFGAMNDFVTPVDPKTGLVIEGVVLNCSLEAFQKSRIGTSYIELIRRGKVFSTTYLLGYDLELSRERREAIAARRAEVPDSGSDFAWSLTLVHGLIGRESLSSLGLTGEYLADASLRGRVLDLLSGLLRIKPPTLTGEVTTNGEPFFIHYSGLPLFKS